MPRMREIVAIAAQRYLAFGKTALLGLSCSIYSSDSDESDQQRAAVDYTVLDEAEWLAHINAVCYEQGLHRAQEEGLIRED